MQDVSECSQSSVCTITYDAEERDLLVGQLKGVYLGQSLMIGGKRVEAESDRCRKWFEH